MSSLRMRLSPTSAAPTPAAGQLLDIGARVDAAFAHQHRAVLHQFRQPQRGAEIRLKRSQVAVVDPQQAVAAVREIR